MNLLWSSLSVIVLAIVIDHLLVPTFPTFGSGAVLVTGCNSGLGRATAIRLARDGFLVFGTVRKQDQVFIAQALYFL